MGVFGTPKFLEATEGVHPARFQERDESKDKYFGNYLFPFKPDIRERNDKTPKSLIEINGDTISYERVTTDVPEEVVVGVASRTKQIIETRGDLTNIQELRELLVYIETKLGTLLANSDDYDDDEKANEAEWLSEKESVKSNITEALEKMWNLPEKLLIESAAPSWRRTVTKYMRSLDYYKPGGVHVDNATKIWGLQADLDVLLYVLARWVVDECGFPENTAERLGDCLQNNYKYCP